MCSNVPVLTGTRLDILWKQIKTKVYAAIFYDTVVKMARKDAGRLWDDHYDFLTRFEDELEKGTQFVEIEHDSKLVLVSLDIRGVRHSTLDVRPAKAIVVPGFSCPDRTALIRFVVEALSRSKLRID